MDNEINNTNKRPRLREKRTWTLRKAYADQVDRTAIKAFLDQTIWKNKAGTDALYRWKYDDNSYGKALMLIVEGEQKEIVGLGVFMPWMLTRGAEYIGASQWIDLIVSFSYRGQGIADAILQEGLKAFREEGDPVCFAFPNANSVPVHQKNNGFLLGYLNRYVKPLRSEYLVSRKIKNQFFLKLFAAIVDFMLRILSKETYCFRHGFTFEKAEDCSKEFDVFWNVVIRQNPQVTVSLKDAKYLNWKYVHSPNPKRFLVAARLDGELKGFIVVEDAERSGHIIDIAATDSAALNQLIAYAVKYFRTQGKDSAVFVCLENNMYLGDFRQFGFVERTEKNHFYLYCDEAMPNKEQLRDSKNWFITIGDCDVDSM